MSQFFVVIIFSCVTFSHALGPFISFCLFTDVGKQCVPATASGNRLELGHPDSNVTETSDLKYNITCLSSDPIRWAINVVPGLPVNRYGIQVLEDNTTKGLFGLSIITDVVVGMRGTVRCISFLNQSNYDEIFLETIDEPPKFLWPSEKLTLFVAPEGSAQDFVVPCESSGSATTNNSGISLDDRAKLFKLDRRSGIKISAIDRHIETYKLVDKDAFFSTQSNNASNDFKNLKVEEEISFGAYDKRTGFILKQSPNYNSIYVCARENGQQLEAFLPLDPRNEVPSIMYYGDVSEPVKMSGIICEVPDKEMINLYLSLKTCSTSLECDLDYHSNIQTLGFVNSDMILDPVEEQEQIILPSVNARKRMIIPLLGGSGIVGCFGNHSPKSSGKVGYVRNIDHYFTGLDNKIYMLSKYIPPAAVISFVVEDAGSEDSRTFICRMSNYAVIPEFEIVVNYENGSRSILRVDEMISMKMLVMGRIRIKLERAMSTIACRCRLVHSKKFYSAEVPLEFARNYSGSRLSEDTNLSY